MARTFELVRPNSPECNKIVRNAPKCQFRVQWGGSGVFVAKNSDATSWHELLHWFGPTVPNATKSYVTHQNISLGSNGVDRVRSLRKITTRLRGTNYCTSSAHFAPCFVRQPNGPECTQTVRNTPKFQFMVKWGGSGAFVAKNSDPTLWHELLH